MRNFIQYFWNEQRFHWLAAGLGALLALLVIYNAHGTINRDGILYIRVASHFISGEWTQGVRAYPWPFYPLILATLHQVSGLQLQTIGHLLSITFFAASAAAFVLILREMGGKREEMLAGLLLLLASPYLVGDIVSMIVREHGFWACLLWGLWFLMRFYNTHRLRYALAWGMAASLATLFRIEGLPFLALLPLALLFQANQPWHARLAHLLKAHAVLLAGVAMLLGVLLLHPSIRLSDLGRLQEPLAIATKVIHEFTHGLRDKAQLFGAQILGEPLEGFALPGLLLTLGWALLMKIGGTAGIAQSLLFAGALLKRRVFCGVTALPVLVTFTLIALVNCVFILLNNFLLSGRMTSPAAFAITLCAAFGLASLYRNATTPGQATSRKWLLLVSLLITGQLLMTVWPPSHGASFEVDAATWMESRKQVNERVFYDDMRLRHYAGADLDWEYTSKFRDHPDPDWVALRNLFEQKTVGNYDYLVVHDHKKHPERLQYLNDRLGQPIMQFDSGRSKRIVVYRVPASLQHQQPQ